MIEYERFIKVAADTNYLDQRITAMNSEANQHFTKAQGWLETNNPVPNTAFLPTHIFMF